MGVIIAVTIWPNGAAFVVIPERYPHQGAQSSRLTVPPARNPATLEDGGMGSQVARSVPEKLLGLLNAFSHDGSAHSLSELARPDPRGARDPSLAGDGDAGAGRVVGEGTSVVGGIPWNQAGGVGCGAPGPSGNTISCWPKRRRSW